jgi:AcrR family transcriptional regulator
MKSPRSASSAVRLRSAQSPPTDKDLTPTRKQNILRAAERLFATRGFHGVSIRDIADEAGVPLALVGYYYGPKLELYHEIYYQRAGYVAQRLESLARAQREAPTGQQLEAIIAAFVLPVLQVAAIPDGRLFLRLMARGINDGLAEDEAVVRELFDPLAHAFIDALAQVAPQVSRGTLAWCYQFALGAMLHHVIDERVERLSRGENRPDDEATAGPLLVRFITEGLRGVCCPPPH